MQRDRDNDTPGAGETLSAAGRPGAASAAARSR